MKKFGNVVLVVLALIPFMSFSLDPLFGDEIQEVQKLINQVNELKKQSKKLRFWNVEEKKALESQIARLSNEIAEREVGIQEFLKYR